jgi:hypothetical protein
MRAADACRLAAELNDEYGELALRIAGRAVATFTAEGLADRADVWRTLQAILADIAAKRIDPHAPIAIH